MGAVGEGHEWEEGPIILDCWVGPIFNAKPVFNLRSSAQGQRLDSVTLGGSLPGVMEAHHTNDGREATVLRHCGALRIYKKARRLLKQGKVLLIDHI